ncbi:MAG TPA: TonB-dependent receptor [Cytophagaceae bacterium]
MKQNLCKRKWYVSEKKLKYLSFISPLLIMLLLVSQPALSQDEQVIKGKVTTEDGETLAGAAIGIKGTTIGTQSDIDGNFTLKVPDAYKDSVLVISYFGYESQEVKIGPNLKIKLVEENKALNEVIVVGYGVQKKSDITGSISKVSGEELKESPVFSGAQALQGRASGVSVVQNTGSPGAPVTVRVRGVGTVGNSNPLYVVDGIPLGDINFLSVNDIASIEVLKDASAAAIYGARAANGVVLITTHQGKEGKRRINFDMYTGVQSPWKKINLLNASQWAMLRNEAKAADGKPIEFNNPDSLGKGTDWQDALFRNAMIGNYQLSASGGKDKTTYYMSGNIFKQQGIIQKSDYTRYTYRLNLNHELTSKLNVGNTLNLMSATLNDILEADEFNSVVNQALTIDPVTPIRNADGSYAQSQFNNKKNPLALLDTRYSKLKGTSLIGSVYGEYEIIKDLKVKTSLGIEKGFASFYDFIPTYDLAVDDKKDVSTVTRQENQSSTTIWENTVTYSKTFAEKHTITGTGLFGTQYNRFEWLTATKSNTPNNDPSMQHLGAATNPDALADGRPSEWALVSYMARGNYEFANKYLFTATVRVDGSSRFAKGNRYGTFPSFAAGWKITEEEFMKQLNWLSFLKLRASWGELGNQNIQGGNYPYTTTISSGQNYSFGTISTKQNGSAPRSAGNSEIKWETVQITNIGLDWGFLKDRINVTTEFFVKNTKDMLVRVPVPGIVGLEEYPYVNAGSIRNSGFELSADYQKSEGIFTFTAGGNITFLKNKVTSLGKGGEAIFGAPFRNIGTVTRTDIGHTVGEFYGYVTDGIFQNEEEVRNSAQSDVAKPGDIRFKDLNNDGVINDKDRTYIGSAIPKFMYGINGTAKFKNFDLTMFFQGSHGNKIFNGNRYYLMGGVPYTNMINEMLNRWTGEGTSNEIPRMTEDDPNQNRRISDYYVESGSYFRLKVLQIGYTLPESLLSKAHIAKMRIFIGGQNIFTITKYTGLDPEIGLNGENFLDFGVDRGTYPQARTFLTGINLTF